MCACFSNSLENHSAIQTKAVLNSFKYRLIFGYFANPKRQKAPWRCYGLVLAPWPCPVQLLPVAHPSPWVRKCQQRFRCFWGSPSPQPTSPSDTDLCVPSLCTGNMCQLFGGSIFFCKIHGATCSWRIENISGKPFILRHLQIMSLSTQYSVFFAQKAAHIPNLTPWLMLTKITCKKWLFHHIFTMITEKNHSGGLTSVLSNISYCISNCCWWESTCISMLQKTIWKGTFQCSCDTTGWRLLSPRKVSPRFLIWSTRICRQMDWYLS